MTERHFTGIVVCLAAITVMSVGGCTSKLKSPVEVSDIDILQGTWVGTELGHNEGQWTFIISGTKVNAKGPEPEAYSGTLKLNAEVDPKQADFAIEKCSIQEYAGTTALGIYRIEGDKLTIVASEPGSAVRPSLFEVGGGARVFTLTRQ